MDEGFGFYNLINPIDLNYIVSLAVISASQQLYSEISSMNGLNRTQYDELISILVLMDTHANDTHLMDSNHHH
ncbi:MAG: hypothetical protein VZR10_08005 [Methanobrevibacter sp.]|nr:hypothetical protein [Methanobrevibacter sp.]